MCVRERKKTHMRKWHKNGQTNRRRMICVDEDKKTGIYRER